jgi:hypothetical protein
MWRGRRIDMPGKGRLFLLSGPICRRHAPCAIVLGTNWRVPDKEKQFTWASTCRPGSEAQTFRLHLSMFLLGFQSLQLAGLRWWEYGGQLWTLGQGALLGPGGLLSEGFFKMTAGQRCMLDDSLAPAIWHADRHQIG